MGFMSEMLDFSERERDCKRWLRTTETLKILPSYIYLTVFIMKEKSYVLMGNKTAHNWTAQR